MFSTSKARTFSNICSDERHGRYLVATKDIKANEVVLKEVPLVHGPAQITRPVCVGCLMGLVEKQFLECERCGWPVCKRECQNHPDHQAECKFTIARGSKMSLQHFYVPHPVYQCLIPLRCLLLAERNPAKWQALIKLESHEEHRRGSEQWRNDREGVAKLIPRFFKCENKWSEDEILKIVGILQVNAHEIPLTEPSSVAVYNNASLIEHSCHPNLSKSFTVKKEIVFWAPHPIKKGERLSICYSDVLWGTVNRMEHLLQTKLFRCGCDRCVDPTEFGTYFSAMRCSGFKKDANCIGLLLPENVKNWNGDWICNKCRGTVEAKDISNIESRASVDQQAMQKDNEQHCNLYITHYSRWLAPNHHFIVAVKLSLSQIIGGGHPEAIKTISDDNLMNKIKICQELIHLFEKICPAEARVIGATRFELHAALAEFGRRGVVSKNPAVRSALEDSLFNAEECVRMLQHEPDELPEHKICEQARINVSSLKTLLGLQQE
ncbi:SET domain-containing protein SmydA-8 isoform X2 [Toxorhynchites rutilus septentrionalis]|uniref:SET domain-containing protein SmydA-8 isoform X2 n=1 Tax=Toxorhynchites rutilus septentrionalis TaxID=329112 RepID=UPI0024798CAC|nr:SET domain-containing protein SmydA-8 isoform X2 [Toxorhynchites rutilus septentrionalis]